jgi:hypothetical protein
MRPYRLLLIPAGLAFAGALAASAPSVRAETEPAPDALTLRPGERQLFLDDFILGDLNRVTRVIHQPRKHGPAVIAADQPSDGQAIQIRDAPSWDAETQRWKVWYMRFGDDGNGAGGSGYAESKDGIHWEKPTLGLVEIEGSRQNNVVMVKDDPRAFTQHVLIDPHAPPDRRYKGMIGPRGRQPIVSADGFTFTKLNVPAIPSQDESHLNWDQSIGQYILTVKHGGPFGRSVYLSLSRDFEHWTKPELIYHADTHDQELGAKYLREVQANPRLWRPTIDRPDEYNAEIYNMAVFRYEGLYIGLPNYFESSGRIPPPRGNQDGINSPKLASSRDLRSWTRVGDRSHFIPISEMSPGLLDTGQIMASSHPILRGDELWFYYSGIDVRHRPNIPRVIDEYRGAIYLATLRRDGFVSLRAEEAGGMVLTRPLALEGQGLRINAVAAGEIRAEITGRDGRPLPGWDAEKCLPVTGDQLQAELRWRGRELSELSGQTVRVRFLLDRADLYSFWVE